MALALLPFGTGQNVRILIQAVAKSNADFSIALTGSAYSLFGRIESFSDDYALHDSDLTPMDFFQDNPVPYGAAQMYTVTELESYIASSSGSTLNVMRTIVGTSFYAALVAQRGYMAGSTWTPTTQDQAIVKFNTKGFSAQRDSMRGTAAFQCVPYVDSSTGIVKPNPIIGNTSQLATPFAFVA